ncbi:hypothetical protein O7602_00315 [Micromonospora sp. WMMD1128]|uniref:hypothetical protein n=1 Tax=Micromonospora sp. WMMD1128 TaxID=3015150 RepID=UPI00248AAC7B|nr:hypothetical protein [Micromonospora sp. WMMD1128]WBB74050.1 hypothetical protein O7602_00315 [Micromonospora sp. WMMD1128]
MWADPVERAGERLYAVFAGHPMPSDMAACEHCVDPADVDRFRRTPLRALTPEQLGSYLSNPGTWGDGSELPHLAPRLLTAYAAGEMVDHSWPDTLARRIARHWAGWTPAERDAVGDFFRAWWRWTLTSWPSTYPAEDLLNAVAELRLGLDPYLADFAELTGEAPLRHLADTVRWSAPEEPARGEMERWWASETPTDLLWAAAVAHAGTRLGDELVEAANSADLLRKTR